MHQDLYDKAKKIIKQDACTKFYNASRTVYLETSVSGVGIGAGLVQVGEGMNFGYDEVPDNVAV